jgi:RNA polymerase sigma-70 factor, ECF subfamily
VTNRSATVTTTSSEFERRADPHRRELLVHCYRMLGSMHDAEDAVQETMLRAWRSYDTFDEQRASLRTWLYRIATNACLTALKSSRRRPLPSGLGQPSEDPDQPLVAVLERPWLEPFPTPVQGQLASDPALQVTAHEGIRLAFVAALQLLPARQRAALILRDVLDYPAAEVATMLGTSPAAVNSALQRARAAVDGLVAYEEPDQQSAATGRAVIDQYVTAFESADIEALTRLLADDVILEMPPLPLWYSGRDHYGRFIARVFRIRGPRWRMLPTVANDQPALGAYVFDGGTYQSHSLQVFTVVSGRITHNIVFADPGLFPAFGLPPRLA